MFQQPAANRFSTAKQKPVKGGGGGHNVSPSLNKVKYVTTAGTVNSSIRKSRVDVSKILVQII